MRLCSSINPCIALALIIHEAYNNENVTAFSCSIAWCSYYLGFDTSPGSIRFGYDIVALCHIVITSNYYG